MKKAAIFDLNNTLRKKSGAPRHDILKKAEKDEKKEKVVILSGESVKDKDEARDWLDEHNLKEAELYMRPKGERAHDEVEKAHIINKLSRQFKFNNAYDDKTANVKMLKSHGINAKEA